MTAACVEHGGGAERVPRKKNADTIREVARHFAILEDTTDRIEKMRVCAATILPALELVFFGNAFEMIEWLNTHLNEVSLISLDHDLPLRDANGKSVDCGDGRTVADYLAGIPPTCPVIVHSSNADCAAGMFFALERAGWPTKRVVPVNDLVWVERDWIAELQRLVSAGWLG
jgi:NAD+-processing family protein with receiver domain